MEWDGDFGPHSPSGREHMPLPTELGGPGGTRGYKHAAPTELDPTCELPPPPVGHSAGLVQLAAHEQQLLLAEPAPLLRQPP